MCGYGIKSGHTTCAQGAAVDLKYDFNYKISCFSSFFAFAALILYNIFLQKQKINTEPCL